jgi:hypothetical protein
MWSASVCGIWNLRLAVSPCSDIRVGEARGEKWGEGTSLTGSSFAFEMLEVASRDSDGLMLPIYFLFYVISKNYLLKFKKNCIKTIAYF